MTDEGKAEPPQLDRRVLAIMATDVVGYSRQMEADEAGTITRVTSMRADVVEPLLARHHGRLIKLIGDGTLSVFDSVVDCVACAAAIQRAIRERNRELPEAEQMVLRIGINLGDVALLENDVYGDGVNVAARIESLCDPGGIMVSGTAYDHLQGKVDVPLEFAGDQRVKNINRPVRTYRAKLEGAANRRWRWPRLPVRALVAALTLLALSGIAATFWSTAPASASRPPVAVLPFRHVASDQVSAQLAETLPREIATQLARFRTVDLIVHDDDVDGSHDLRSIGRDLAVRYLLSGAIQREQERIRVTARLVEATRGHEVWADHWDRPITDLLALQTELAEAVASRVASPYSGAIVAADRDLAKAKASESLTAYDLDLLGTEARERGDLNGLKQAITLHERSIALQPDLSRSWSGLAAAHGDLAALEGYPPERQAAREAAARKAVELDPADPAAHTALAAVYVDKGEPARAQAEFDKALTLNPASADLLAIYAGWASDLGEADRGAQAAERAIQLDPGLPGWAVVNFSYAFFMVGVYDKAVRLIDGLPAAAYSPATWVYRAAALGALGRREEATRAVTAALAANPGLSVELFAAEYGTTDEQRQRLVATMRAAGFPVCAPAVVFTTKPGLRRLPECMAS